MPKARIPMNPYNLWNCTKAYLCCMFQSIHPPNARLTKQEMSNICYLAFPDSNSGCMGDTQFTIRLRRSPGQLETSPSSSNYGRHLPPKHFFWGYVYFRQVKDITLPRGYFQKVSICHPSRE